MSGLSFLPEILPMWSVRIHFFDIFLRSAYFVRRQNQIAHLKSTVLFSRGQEINRLNRRNKPSIRKIGEFADSAISIAWSIILYLRTTRIYHLYTSLKQSKIISVFSSAFKISVISILFACGFNTDIVKYDLIPP